jgi:hypothetical protein
MGWAGHVTRVGEMHTKHFRCLGVGGRQDLKGVVCVVVEWIHLAQNRDQWRALVNAVMKPRVPVTCEKFLD